MRDSVLLLHYPDKYVTSSVLRKAGLHRNGTIFQKSVQLLAYATTLTIIGCEILLLPLFVIERDLQ